MNKKSLVGGIAMSAIGVAVLAHNGATGVTLERMNGMVALRGVMRQMAPMMQGQTAYDVRAVQVAGATIIAHAGTNMTKLFPQEQIAAASYAKPEIWESWEEFSALSEQLKAYGLGLSLAAPNGLSRPAPTPAAVDPSDPVDHASMQVSDDVADGSGTDVLPFSVAELMGVAPPKNRNAPAPTQASSSANAQTGGFDFTQMAAPQAFEMISSTCASCHSAFRNGN